MRKSKVEKLILFIRPIADKIKNDNLTGYAAQSCFYLVLSFVPFVILLMSLLKYLPVTPDEIFEIMDGVFPAILMPILTSVINDIYYNSNIAVISITTIIALWSAGKGFISIILCFNQIYDCHKKQGWIISRIFSSLYIIVFLVSIILTLMLFVFGKHLLVVIDLFLPKIGSLLQSILNNKTLLFPGTLMVIFWIMYVFIPYRKTKFLAELPGAVTAAVGWVLFSIFYSLYADYSPSFSTMYGTLSTLVFALIWLYFCMLIVFFGAELNALIALRKSLKDACSDVEEIKD
jgi:membrane protein